MTRLRSGTTSILSSTIRWCIPLGLGLAMFDCAAAQTPAASEVRPTPAGAAGSAMSLQSRPGAPFAAADRAAITQRILADPQLAQIRSDRVRVLSVVPSVPRKEQQPRVANTILFDYTQGRAYRASLDLESGAVTRLEALPGRPQPSPEEINEASSIVAADAAHARLMRGQGAVLEGGFAVDGPPGSSARDRFVQFHLVTRDRLHFLREVTVDLTTRKIAASTPRQ